MVKLTLKYHYSSTNPPLAALAYNYTASRRFLSRAGRRFFGLFFGLISLDVGNGRSETPNIGLFAYLSEFPGDSLF